MRNGSLLASGLNCSSLFTHFLQHHTILPVPANDSYNVQAEFLCFILKVRLSNRKPVVPKVALHRPLNCGFASAKKMSKCDRLATLETALFDIIDNDDLPNDAIIENVEKVLCKRKRGDTAAIDKWIKEFFQEEDIYYEEDNYNSESSSDIWNHFSEQLEKIERATANLDFVNYDYTMSKAIVAFCDKQRKFWDDLPSSDACNHAYDLYEEMKQIFQVVK